MSICLKMLNETTLGTTWLNMKISKIFILVVTVVAAQRINEILKSPVILTTRFDKVCCFFSITTSEKQKCKCYNISGMEKIIQELIT